MSREVPAGAAAMLPNAPLPNPALAASHPSLGPALAHRQAAGEHRLEGPPAGRTIVVARRQGANAMAMIGEHHPGVDGERAAPADDADGIPQVRTPSPLAGEGRGEGAGAGRDRRRPRCAPSPSHRSAAGPSLSREGRGLGERRSDGARGGSGVAGGDRCRSPLRRARLGGGSPLPGRARPEGAVVGIRGRRGRRRSRSTARPPG